MCDAGNRQRGPAGGRSRQRARGIRGRRALGSQRPRPRLFHDDATHRLCPRSRHSFAARRRAAREPDDARFVPRSRLRTHAAGGRRGDRSRDARTRGNVGSSAGLARRVARFGFTGEQRLLALDAPAIAAEPAVSPYDAVAGDRDGDWIRGTRLRDGAHCAGAADTLGDLGIGRRGAGRDRAQRLPDTLLERRTAQIERQLDRRAAPFDEADAASHHLLECRFATDELRLREAIVQRTHQALGIIAQHDRTDALVGCCDKDSAQRALADREANRGTDTTGAELLWPHAKQRVRNGIESAARPEPGAVDRFRHAAGARQFVVQPPRAAGGRVAPRRYAGHCLEHTMEVEAAHVRCAGQRAQVRRRFRRLDRPTGLGLDGGTTGGEGGCIGATPFAGPEPRRLGRYPAVVKRDVLAPCRARRAVGTAINAGRPYRVIEVTIGSRIASLHRFPTLGFRRERLRSFPSLSYCQGHDPLHRLRRGPIRGAIDIWHRGRQLALRRLLSNYAWTFKRLTHAASAAISSWMNLRVASSLSWPCASNLFCACAIITSGLLSGTMSRNTQVW